jgi:hypothetical protein
MQTFPTTHRNIDMLEILDGPIGGYSALDFGRNQGDTIIVEPEVDRFHRYRRQQDETGAFYRYVGPA